MKCYCPKCGRENEVSVADLRRQKGTVVCPKCLTTFQMPYANSNDDGDDTPPPQSQSLRAEACRTPHHSSPPKGCHSEAEHAATCAIAHKSHASQTPPCG